MSLVSNEGSEISPTKKITSSEPSFLSNSSKSSTKTINFTVNVVFSFEKSLGTSFARTPTASTSSKKTGSGRHIFNVEYNLHPTNQEYTFKIDVIVHSTSNGVVARVYNEKLVAKNKVVWEHDNSMWIAFQNTHSLIVDDDFLEAISNHVVTIKISNSKEKCSKGALSDNVRHFVMPKAVPGEDPEDRGNTRPFIFAEINKFLETNKKQSNILIGDKYDISACYTILEEKTTLANPTETEECILELKLSPLLAGHLFTSERLQFCHKYYNDVFTSINVEKTLIHEENSSILCPLVLRLNFLSNMPNQPHSFEELRICCKMCYVTFEAFGKRYKSFGKLQEKNILFDEYFVFLLGLRSKEEVNDFISTPLVFEIHDRDSNKEKLEYNQCDLLPQLPKYEQETLNSYGIATFDFSKELLGNCKYIILRSFVTNCSAPNISPLNMESKLIMKSANYIESSTEMKIDVKVFFSFRDFIKNAVLNEKMLYKRIVICMETRHFSHKDVIQPIFDHNYQVLSQYTKCPSKLISSFTREIIDVLETIPEENDLVSGFYICDVENSLILLEGMIEGFLDLFQKHVTALRSLYDAKIIFSNSVTFFKRLYMFWRLDFEPINLFRPLSDITKQPLLYVRDMIPKSCFRAISKLNIISQSNSMKSLVRNDAFPLLEELEYLNKEFGLPKIERKQSKVGDSGFLETEETGEPSKLRHVQIDNKNHVFEMYLKEKSLKTKNFEKINKKNLKKFVKRVSRDYFRLNSDIQICPYSLQKFNCYELTLNYLKKYLKEKYGNYALFSYNEDYHGNTWEVDEPIKKKMTIFRKQGWIKYIKSIEKKVTDFRREEINSKWEENFYNNEFMNPVLPYRNNYKGEGRRIDFDIWTKVKESKYQMSLHAREKKDLALKGKPERDIMLNYHRLNIRTEKIEGGRHAASQIDKLVGMNKCNLKKKSTIDKQDSCLFDKTNKYNQDKIWMNKYFYKFISLQPGDFIDKSLFHQDNIIPSRFEKERPYLRARELNFKTDVRDRSYIHKILK